MEDDSFDEDALYHAEDLDKITLGQKQANLSARIKMDLELQPDMTEIYPLGKGHFIDEWDYKIESTISRRYNVKLLPTRVQSLSDEEEVLRVLERLIRLYF